MSQSENEGLIKNLFDEFYEKLCLYAEGIVKNHQVAEEIVEDLFVYIWLHSATIKINYSFKSYLFRSVHNNCIKYLRQAKNERGSGTHDLSEFDDEKILYPLSADLPVSLVISEELKQKAEEILEKLPHQCRNIYILSHYEDMSYSEIAKKLNISIGTVKTQMYRAFQKLREGLKDYI